MEKYEILEGIKSLVKDGVLTKKELMDTYSQAAEDKTSSLANSQSRLSAILYFVGGIIVFLGITILVGQNWTYLNNTTKIVVTLGSAIAAYIMGLLFSRYQSLNVVSQAFYFISGLIAPLGITIAFDIAGLGVHKLIIQSFMASIVFAVFITSYLLFRKEVFLIFSIIFGSWLYFAFTGHLIELSSTVHQWRTPVYQVLFANVSYLILGYYYSKEEKATLITLSHWLYGVGIFGFLTAAIILGGWKPEQSVFWELSYPLWIFATLFLSTLLKRKTLLLAGVLYLIGYIFKITSEYFAQDLGWPVSLVLVGLAIIGISYLALYLNRKYISK
ncbi:MAG: DUF2157 domain-containing protein [Candidatus Omnitrophota bacterium]